MADEFARVYILGVEQPMSAVLAVLCIALIFGFALAFWLVLGEFDNR